jgi:hypothetical protein
MNSQLDQLVELLKRTAKSHHEAFQEVNGDDPEWPAWYAKNMLPDFEEILDRSISEEGLGDLIKRFDELHAEEAPGEYWAQYYARKLLNFYSE